MIRCCSCAHAAQFPRALPRNAILFAIVRPRMALLISLL